MVFFRDFKGTSISLHKLSLLPKRFNAIKNRQLKAEHRYFLALVSFDESGHPIMNGRVAGINGCLEFKKA